MASRGRAWTSPNLQQPPRREALHLKVDERGIAKAQLDGFQQLSQQLVVRLAAHSRVPRTHVERAAQQLLAVRACARAQQGSPLTLTLI